MARPREPDENDIRAAVDLMVADGLKRWAAAGSVAKKYRASERAAVQQRINRKIREDEDRLVAEARARLKPETASAPPTEASQTASPAASRLMLQALRNVDTAVEQAMDDFQNEKAAILSAVALPEAMRKIRAEASHRGVVLDDDEFARVLEIAMRRLFDDFDN